MGRRARRLGDVPARRARQRRLPRGIGAAIATAFGGFLLYNFLFVHPNFTLDVSDPGELLNSSCFCWSWGSPSASWLLPSAAAPRQAIEREHEARALFRISRTLATRTETGGGAG